MRIIRSLSDLDSTIDPAVEHLVRQRLEMLAEYGDDELAVIFIPEAGDSLADVEQATGLTFADPAWEWVLDHGTLYEAPLIISDDGFAHVLIVTDTPGFDPDMLSHLRAHAQAAHDPDSSLI
ncbi:hypothetical protein [Novosphingobium aerophilum]|uniref:Uncharacterized protein n=1 Tax=Novosphingobium aerophilum TaxID=2839843 RepID=A0A7X1KDG2_9SPHN|nr:hypothetical protein [Novosphingobium aerophilum]MBC2653286.1 hypothetical protein [Novosphingobium aerophilum]